MEKIKQFLDTVFEKEVIAFEMQFQKEKVEAFNEYIEKELNSNCLPYFDEEWEVEIPFNLLGKMIPNLPEVFYQTDEKANEIRHIFKISEYRHERYGTIWACYVSSSKPSYTIKNIFNCFIVAELEGTLKFISKMTVEPDTKKWKHSSGNKSLDLRLNELGKPTKIERYTEPISKDDWSIKEYLKDK